MKTLILFLCLAFGNMFYAQGLQNENSAKDLFDLNGEKVTSFLAEKQLCADLAKDLEKSMPLVSEVKKSGSRYALQKYYSDMAILAFAQNDYRGSLKNLLKARSYCSNDVEKSSFCLLKEAYLRAKIDPDVQSEAELRTAIRKNLCKSLLTLPYSTVVQKKEEPMFLVSLPNGHFLQEFRKEGIPAGESIALAEIPREHALQLLYQQMENEAITPFKEDIYLPAFEHASDRDYLQHSW